MKTEVYEIWGCAGSQKLRSRRGVFPTLAEARKVARSLNEDAAGNLGMTYRDYRKNEFGEGWNFAARAGFGGWRADGDTFRRMRLGY